MNNFVERRKILPHEAVFHDATKKLCPTTFAVTVNAVTPSGGALLLSEVLYDTSGTDDGLEWVELYNNDTVAIDLSSFSLGNGGTDYTASVVQLSGTIQPGATFVVGGPTSSGPPIRTLRCGTVAPCCASTAAGTI